MNKADRCNLLTSCKQPYRRLTFDGAAGGINTTAAYEGACLQQQLDAAGAGALAAGGAGHEALVRLLDGVELVAAAWVLVRVVPPRQPPVRLREGLGLGSGLRLG